MTDQPGRGSEEVWLDAAYRALVEGGVEAVRILPLAKGLGLSRTSFYWFFADREALLTALIERWKDKNTGAILRHSAAYAETVAEAMLNVIDCWLDARLFDAEFEFAVRSWALQSGTVSRAVAEADAARLAALTGIFARFGYSAHEADVRARTVYLVQIGYISMNTRETMATRLSRIPEYVEIFTGRRPEPNELARFLARHGGAQTTPEA